MSKYENSCPCGAMLKTDMYAIHSQFARDHNAEHVEKVIELKSKTPVFPSIGYANGGAINTPCSCNTVVTA